MLALVHDDTVIRPTIVAVVPDGTVVRCTFVTVVNDGPVTVPTIVTVFLMVLLGNLPLLPLGVMVP